MKISFSILLWIFFINLNRVICSIAFDTAASQFFEDELSSMKDNISFFDLKDQRFNAKVVDVYDGDTCSIVIRLNDQWTKFKLRSYGYDTPEIRPPKDSPHRNELIDMAVKARNYFVSRVTDCAIDLSKHYNKKELKEIINSNKKIISITSRGWDKYGRMLGDIYVDNVYLNEEMVRQRYGYKYDGGKKEVFEVHFNE